MKYLPTDILVEFSRLINIDRNTLAEKFQFTLHLDSITKLFKETFTIFNDDSLSPIDQYFIKSIY